MNGKTAQLMVDTGASHNFVSPTEARRFGLKVAKSKGWLKTFNAQAKPISRVAHGQELQLNTWHDKVDFSVAPMDDFNIVLGIDFLKQFNVVPLPRLNMVMILEEAPCIVPAVTPAKETSPKLGAMFLSDM